MSKRMGLLAMGGHISNQNAMFQELMRKLADGWEFFGLNNGFKAFETRELYELNPGFSVGAEFAGFYAGAARATLTDKDTGEIVPEKLHRAVEFIRAAKLDYIVGSGGDDHGKQLGILADALQEYGINVLVANKTMDGDKGGIDGGLYTHDEHGSGYGPFAHTTNGFHTAIEAGLQQIIHHYAGAWTNELATIVPHFGRDANWVNAALAWYGFADLALFGELAIDNDGHSIADIAEATHVAMDANQQRYGRRFATIVVAEGTRVQGIESISGAEDDHGHPKLNPESFALGLKAFLGDYDISSQTLTLTYELRNHPASKKDTSLARLTATELAKAVKASRTGMEATLIFEDGKVKTDLVPIQWASEQRLTAHYERADGSNLYVPRTFTPADSIETYFKPLLGERGNLASHLPVKPTVISIP
tara:strand:- start:4466 stop:5725 length:1260 start_codon:yes stop_codon:yes gene_type:complete